MSGYPAPTFAPDGDLIVPGELGGAAYRIAADDDYTLSGFVDGPARLAFVVLSGFPPAGVDAEPNTVALSLSPGELGELIDELVALRRGLRETIEAAA